MGENSCKPWDQQGVNIQNIQIAHTIQYQRDKQPNKKKRAEGLTRHFSKENTQMANK